MLITAILFGVVHLPEQGLFGAAQATITGLAFGTICAVTGGLALPMIAHAAFDLTAVAIIYWDLELRVAQLLFR